MEKLIKNSKTGYKVIDTVLDQSEDFMNHLISKYEEFTNEPIAGRNREYLKLELIFDLIKAFSNYTLKTDDVSDITFKISKGVIGIKCDIIRDNVKHLFSTETIYAEGVVQRLHTRYIVSTSLRKISSSTALNNIKEVQKKMKKEDKIKNDISYIKNVIARETNNLLLLESKSNEDITNENDLENKYPYNPLNTNFPTKESYNLWLKNNIERDIENHCKKLNYIKQYLKTLNKDLLKHESKLKNLSI